MSSDIAIKVENLSKCYQIYEQPRDRLKQFVMPRLQRGLGKQPKQYYREFWALKDVSFEVKKGETVGIIGRNGSGKSTLLQIICGTLNPTGGTVTTHGRIAALLELGSGFNPDFTGRENVYMNAAVLGLSTQEIDQRFDAIAAFADIGEFIEQPVKTYSSGMMVRLAFAVAINVEPDILVVDEALAVGDELFQRKCFSKIEIIKDAGATILFVSHSGAIVVDLCGHALILDAAELIGVGQPKNMVGKYQKLLYAPAESHSAVRLDIMRTSLADGRKLFPGSLTQTATSMAIKLPAVDTIIEYFDPHLVPQSTISYESRGTFIRNPQILTLAGERVNSLKRGKTYRYCFEVFFEQSANNVRFGMLIKTTTGTELGGAASALNRGDTIPVVSAGTLAKAEFSFVCALNAGVYFLNAGVLGTFNGEEMFLHRLIDLAMFRVFPDTDSLSTGVVDFGINPEYELISLS